jgi:hypothetical protein
MSDIDLPLRRALDALVPELRREPDWSDVLRRAQPRLWHRPLVLALAATVLVLGTAAAVTAALGGFDAWLSGKPGKPAPASEQQRFEAANGRTWASFPKSTQLRELIRTNVEGKRYVLYGFRSGNTFCLKLRAFTLGHSTEPACMPVSTIAHASSPIVLVTSDSGFEDRHAQVSAEFSFGIAADGVSRVEVRAVDGLHKAVIGGNAYLWVENEPNTGNRVLAVTARAANGARTTISLGTTFGDLAPLGAAARRPRGPDRVEAPIAHPTIGWAARGEKRGFSRDRLDLNSYARAHFVSPTARFVKPDPLGDTVVGLDRTDKLLVVQGRGAAGGSFSKRALNVITSGGGGVQSATVAGAAADGIVRLTIFDADGQRFAVPLRDNLFATRVAETQFPLRLVGYDARGRVAALETLRFDLGRSSAPEVSFHRLRTISRVTGPKGVTATVKIGGAVQSIRCWRVDFSTGQAPSGCFQLIPTGPWVDVDLVQPAGPDLFVIGHMRPPVATVEFHFQDGRVLQLKPEGRLFVAAIPRAYLKTRRQLAFAVGYDGAHRVVQRQGFVFRVRP